MNAYERSVEAGLTRDELHRKLFANSTRLPKRRFRVEGTSIGNSPLVTLRKARGLHRLYPGRLSASLEYIPSVIVDLGCAGECPTCKAEPWAPCVVRQGKGKGRPHAQPHPRRLEDVRRTD